MITVVEAAAQSGKHRTTITRAFLRGALKGMQYPDGTILIDENDLRDAFSHGQTGTFYGVKTTPSFGEAQYTVLDDYRGNCGDNIDPSYVDLYDHRRVDPNYYASAKSFTPIHEKVTKQDPKTHTGIRVLYWSDTHVSPGDDMERIRWIANYVKMTKPDHVWHGGDLATFDSCSAHDPIGSKKDKAKPTILADMDVLRGALAIYHDELGPNTIPHSFSEGNHEYRLKRFEDSRGVMEGSLYPQMRDVFHNYGWDFHDYGVISFIEGVGFVHIPFNRMGKPYGSHSVMLRDLTYDLVFGHTHQFQKMSQPKLGEKNRVTLLNGGCTLPFNHVEDYAKLNPTGWDYGVIDMTVYDGHILDSSFLSLPTLERFYKNK